MSLFCVRLSLLICAALDLDIAFRTQKCLPFVPGPEIRMWAAPDEMHRPAAMLTGQLSSAPKSRAPCLVNIAPPISGGRAIGLSATGSLGQAPPADDVSACAQIRTIFKRGYFAPANRDCRTAFGNHMSIRPPPSGRAGI
jgi:hypothetical protein